MPNLASVMKEEIQRLARKEARAQLSKTNRTTAQHRKDLAELKRQVRDLTRQVAYLERREKKRAGMPEVEKTATNMRFSAKSVKAHRAKLALSAADYAQLVGVSALTIYNWEKGQSKPQTKQLTALAAVRTLGKREAWRMLDLMEA